MYLIGKFIYHLVELKELRNSIVFDPSLNEILNELQIPENVTIGYSEKVNSPVVFGFFEPVILLPFAICNQLGVNESIANNVTWPWYLIKVADPDNGDEIMMKFKSTKDGKSYAGFSISSNNGIPFTLGNNTKCTLSIVSGLDVYSCYDLTVNITKEASNINDCYEGTFSGNAKLVIGSQFPPKTQNYPCSGSFRVPLKQKP
jgi:hypothetical protein